MSPPAVTWTQHLGQHREALLQFARRLLRSRSGIDPSDMVQLTLTQAVQTRVPPDNPEGWLRNVLWHRVVDECRQQDHCAIEQLPLHLPGTGTSPSGDAIRRENCQRVRDALAQLLPAERDVIELTYFLNLDWTQKEIADHLGVSRGVVAGRLRRAQANLRNILECAE